MTTNVEKMTNMSEDASVEKVTEFFTFLRSLSKDDESLKEIELDMHYDTQIDIITKKQKFSPGSCIPVILERIGDDWEVSETKRDTPFLTSEKKQHTIKKWEKAGLKGDCPTDNKVSWSFEKDHVVFRWFIYEWLITSISNVYLR